MASTKFFFLGFTVDSDLEIRLQNCTTSNKTFLENNEYLERMKIDETTYLGRRLDGNGITDSSVEDCARNVASLIKRVAPGWSKSPIHAVLTAVEEEILHKDIVLNM